MANEKLCIDCAHLSGMLNVAGYRFCTKWQEIDLVTGVNVYAVARDERAAAGRCKPEAVHFSAKRNPPPTPHSGSGPTERDPGASTNRPKRVKTPAAEEVVSAERE